jgi:DNA ligase-1
MPKLSKTFPTLYKRTKTGKVQQWTISVQETGAGYGRITVEHGQTNGKRQIINKDLVSGKNVGKINETTPFQQALSESSSKWNKQVDAGYTEDSSGVSSVILPMLAKTYGPNKLTQHGVHGIALQPKLNGVRCLAYKLNNHVVLMSRKGKEYTKNLPHIVNALETVLDDNTIFDGELYVHGWSFQKIIRSVKKLNTNNGHKIQYWIYDIANNNIIFKDRYLNLLEYKPYLSKHIFKVVKTYLGLEDQIKEHHDKFVRDGFEGIIIRKMDKVYEFNTRSNSLYKYKRFFDKEVLIVGYKEGTGIEAGCVVWQVRDEFGNLFWSRPKGSHKQRRIWCRCAKRYIGSLLTIRYQELTEDNVPVFNVGIAIRDYE